jgi:hypothetical protein
MNGMPKKVHKVCWVILILAHTMHHQMQISPTLFLSTPTSLSSHTGRPDKSMTMEKNVQTLIDKDLQE